MEMEGRKKYTRNKGRQSNKCNPISKMYILPTPGDFDSPSHKAPVRKMCILPLFGNVSISEPQLNFTQQNVGFTAPQGFQSDSEPRSFNSGNGVFHRDSDISILRSSHNL